MEKNVGLGRAMRRALVPFIVVAWVVFLTGPIAFLYSGYYTPSELAWVNGIYIALIQIVGEPAARLIFGGLWLTLNAALFWRLVLSRHRDKLGTIPGLGRLRLAPYDVGN
jgi:hypothetical protein